METSTQTVRASQSHAQVLVTLRPLNTNCTHYIILNVQIKLIIIRLTYFTILILYVTFMRNNNHRTINNYFDEIHAAIRGANHTLSLCIHVLDYYSVRLCACVFQIQVSIDIVETWYRTITTSSGGGGGGGA